MKNIYALARSESRQQSIDGSMAKFMVRSTLKQYLPLKPIMKRGVKIWKRCDSLSGYIYDINIYSGKQNEITEGTLGERVVKQLTSTVRGLNVFFCFHRLLTSVNLIDKLPFCPIGIGIASRKKMPKFG